MITASKVHAARRCGYAFRPDVPKTPRKPGEAVKGGMPKEWLGELTVLKDKRKAEL